MPNRLCFSLAGFGKTLSARRYAHGDEVEPLFDEWPFKDKFDSGASCSLARAHDFYKPSVSETLGDFERSLSNYIWYGENRINRHLNFDDDFETINNQNSNVELLI